MNPRSHAWLLRGLGTGAAGIAVHDLVRGMDRVARPTGAQRGIASLDSELLFGSAWYAVAGALMLRASREPDRHD